MIAQQMPQAMAMFHGVSDIPWCSYFFIDCLTSQLLGRPAPQTLSGAPIVSIDIGEAVPIVPMIVVP